MYQLSTGSSGHARGQPPAASRDRTRAMSDSSGFSWVTLPIAW